VVGAADRKEGMRRGFLYESGKATFFPSDPDGGGLTSGINAHGEVIGAEMGTESDMQAFLWKAGKTTLLKPGGKTSIAQGINDDGKVVGAIYDAEGRRQAFVWEKGKTTLLTGLDGEKGSHAYAIDPSGVIVGRGDTKEKDGEGSRVHRAVMWKDGQAVDLGALPKYPFSVAYAINGGGWIVGASIEVPADMPPTDSRAILYQNGRLYDLNTLIPADSGWTLYDAKGINSGGMIVGTGRRKGAPELRAYLLVPKP
jgi:probable HAF family extracellular repeat protein